MRRALSVVLAVVAVAVHAQPRPAAKARPDTVETYLRAQMEKRRIPGLQVAVIQREKVTFLGAYGQANVELAVPVTAKTRFSIASATKCFTGVAVVQLSEEGKVDLGAPISRYVDGLPKAWQPVTIRQLLSHTSGLPDLVDDASGEMRVPNDDAASWAQAIAAPMQSAPGTAFSYNQTNYALLGKVIDKVTGKPFVEFIAERQFKPAGMTATGFDDSADVVPNTATIYSYFHHGKRGDKLVHTYFEFSPLLRTAGGITTTAEDLTRWILALQQGRLFKDKASLTTLWTPPVKNDGKPGPWALGWPLTRRAEHPGVGGSGGGRFAFQIYPEDDLTVVILTNLMGAGPGSMLDEVAGYTIPELRAVNGGGLAPGVRKLRAELLKRGFAQAIPVAAELKAKDAALALDEEELNLWGYRLMYEEKQPKEALEIFKLNAQLYPGSWNTHDSLAEAYEEGGDPAAAVTHYRRSLGLNPKNENAAKHLKALAPGAP